MTRFHGTLGATAKSARPGSSEWPLPDPICRSFVLAAELQATDLEERDRASLERAVVGTVELSSTDAGVAHFAASPDGQHRYVVVSDAQRQATLGAIVELAHRPPDGL